MSKKFTVHVSERIDGGKNWSIENCQASDALDFLDLHGRIDRRIVLYDFSARDAAKARPYFQYDGDAVYSILKSKVEQEAQ